MKLKNHAGRVNRAFGIVFVFLLMAGVAQGQGWSADVAEDVGGPILDRARETMTPLPAAEWMMGDASFSSDSTEGPWAGAESTGIRIEGKIAYESTINGATGLSSFSAERIMNYRTTASGFLRLQLWATKDVPVFGTTISFHNLGLVDMNPLSGGFYYTNMMTADRPFNTPPAGTYYISLALLEYQGGNYVYTDIRTFDKTWTIGSGSTPSCTPTSSRFCTQGNRFTVSLWARDQRTGNTDTGNVMLSTSVYGMFAFPVIAGNTNDPQVFVKVLDGRPINGKWWVFCSTLTDVEFKITVHDTVTGQTRIYHKLAGTTSSTFDTSAF